MSKKIKPDYKNWMPKKYLVYLFIFSVLFLFLSVLFFITKWIHFFWLKLVVSAFFFVLFFVFLIFFFIGFHWYKTFFYDGKRQMAKEIVDKLSDYCVDHTGKILDIGCGTGALTIALAKKNPKAKVIGVDNWSREYLDDTLALCYKNAKAEEVDNAIFISMDMKKMIFKKNSFTHITSNYCFSNLPGLDKQKLILQALSLLKKGGTFAIHDVMDRLHFGDMNELVNTLKGLGYEEVHLVETSKGMFISEVEAFFISLNGSYLLYGKK